MFHTPLGCAYISILSTLLYIVLMLYLESMQDLIPKFLETKMESGRKKFAEAAIQPSWQSKELDADFNDSIEDVYTSTQTYINKRYGDTIKKLYFAYGVWIVVVVVFMYLTELWRVGDNIEIAFWAIAFPFILYGGFAAGISAQMVNMFYKQFAKANGYSYTQREPNMYKDLTGALFEVGHSKFCNNVIRGTFNNHPLTIFNYSYTIGHGKGATSHARTVLEVDFDVVLPPILLLGDRHSFGDDLSDNNLRMVSKVELPSDVENHFNLFAEKKYEVEALQIFTPDVLEFLYENYKEFSYDFTGHAFYLYGKKVYKKKDELHKAYELAQYIINRLSKELKVMEGSTKAMNEKFER